MWWGSEEEKTCRISDKDEKLVRDGNRRLKKPLRGRNVSHQFLVFVWYSRRCDEKEQVGFVLLWGSHQLKRSAVSAVFVLLCFQETVRWLSLVCWDYQCDCWVCFSPEHFLKCFSFLVTTEALSQIVCPLPLLLSLCYSCSLPVCIFNTSSILNVDFLFIPRCCSGPSNAGAVCRQPESRLPQWAHHSRQSRPDEGRRFCKEAPSTPPPPPAPLSVSVRPTFSLSHSISFSCPPPHSLSLSPPPSLTLVSFSFPLSRLSGIRCTCVQLTLFQWELWRSLQNSAERIDAVLASPKR